jgi:hypothetical protein
MEEIAQRRRLEFEWRRGLKLAATRDEVGKEDWSWRGLKLATRIEVEGGDEQLECWRLKMAPRPCRNKTINGNWKGAAVWLLPRTSGPDIIAPPHVLPA